MEDKFDDPNLTKHARFSSHTSKKNASLVATITRAFPEKEFKHRAPKVRGAITGLAGDAAFFILKVAALETIRRFSRARFPLAWNGLQAIQVLCCPPFKWIQRWAPFKGFIKGIQMFSRPLLVLSIATAFSDPSEQATSPNDVDDSHAGLDTDSESSSVANSVDTSPEDKAPVDVPSENWLLNLYKELENQGIILPDRVDENELHRFYVAANGDFSCLLTSVKKTIRWRETYGILSEQELGMWSNVVFWHGCDARNRPCLVIRLGLAFISLPIHDRPRFAQAIVSQIEHGILHFVDEENPQVSVLVDCKGLSPLRIPMHILRSCCAIFQEHYPNRLGCLFVIRLPPVARVIAQTFIQVFKPATRQKLKFLGERYQAVLSEHLHTLPAYLGGKCACHACSSASVQHLHNHRSTEMASETLLDSDVSRMEDISAVYPTPPVDVNMDYHYNQVLRAIVMAILMLCVAFAVGLYDPKTRRFASS